MKISSFVKRTIIQSATVLILVSLVQTDAFARGGRGGGGARAGGGGARAGGGGGFTREGPASSGGFSSRSSAGSSQRVASRQSGRSSAQGSRSTNQQNRQNAVAQNRQTGGANQQNRQTSKTQNQSQRQQSREAQTNTRQQGATNRQQNRQNYGENAQQNRQDFANDNWDNYYRPGWVAPVGAVAAGAALGYAGRAAASPTVITTLPCTPAPVVVGQVSYYPCNGTWYQRAYSGNEVTYVVVNAPAGY